MDYISFLSFICAAHANTIGMPVCLRVCCRSKCTIYKTIVARFAILLGIIIAVVVGSANYIATSIDEQFSHGDASHNVITVVQVKIASNAILCTVHMQ